MPNHRPEAVANRFLELAGDEGLTQLQIQKLVYIAHGWTLAVCDEPLTSELPQAWDRGPVYPELRSRLAYAGSNKITKMIQEHDNNPFIFLQDQNRGQEYHADLNNVEKSIIEQVWQNYSGFDGFELSNLTHKVGTAWQITYSKYGRNIEIPNNLTKKHYKSLLEKSGEDG